jgi:hypothetical protein
MNEVKKRWWFYTASPWGAVCVPCFLRHVALKKAGRVPTGVSKPGTDSGKLLKHALKHHIAVGVTYPRGEAAVFGRHMQRQVDEMKRSAATAHAAPMHGTNEEEEVEAGGGRRIVEGDGGLGGRGLGDARPPSAPLGDAAAAAVGAVNAAPDEERVSKEDGMSNEDGDGGGDPSGGTARAPSGDDRDDDFPTGGDDDDDDRKRKRRRTTEDEQEASTSGSDMSSRDDASVVPFDTRHLRKKYKYEDGQVARFWNDTEEDIEQLGALTQMWCN